MCHKSKSLDSLLELWLREKPKILQELYALGCSPQCYSYYFYVGGNKYLLQDVTQAHFVHPPHSLLSAGWGSVPEIIVALVLPEKYAWEKRGGRMMGKLLFHLLPNNLSGGFIDVLIILTSMAYLLYLYFYWCFIVYIFYN